MSPQPPLVVILALAAAVSPGVVARPQQHIVKDCMLVTSEPGDYFFKSDGEAKTCGIYLMAPPDRLVQLYFHYLDVPCGSGLVAWVDGWELGGNFYPSEDETGGRVPRVAELCGAGGRRSAKVLTASQNSALVQYRVLKRGKGFSLRVTFPRNPAPCHVMIEGSPEVVTLRSQGRPANCSITALFPIAFSLLALDVGLPKPHLETGTLRKCKEKGLGDYLEIGGGEQLGLADLQVMDTLCGLDSIPEGISGSLMCGVSRIRLVSSGPYDNSVTLSVRQAEEEDINDSTFICPLPGGEVV